MKNRLKKLFIFLVVACVALVLVACGHTHTLEHHAGQDATCTEAGWKEYDVCTSCGYTNKEEIPALNHILTKHEAKEAGVGVDGNSEYYECTRCHEYFSDSEGKIKIAENSWVIAYDKFRVRVIDADDEVLVDATIPVGKYSNLYEYLTTELNTVGGVGDYGAYITSVNNSIVDANWALMIYVNGSMGDAADKIVPANGDVIELRNECWAAVDYGYGTSMDKYDVIVDKLVYRYLKTKMKDIIKNTTTYTGSTYWDMLSYAAYKSSSLDSNILKGVTFNQSLIDELNNVSVNTLTGANIGKYFSHAFASDILTDSKLVEFKEYYQTVLSGLTAWNDYETPFVVFPASYLNLSLSDNLVNDAVSGNTEWGPTGDCWKLLGQTLFADKDSFDFKPYVKDWTTAYEYGSNTDMATVLLAACALGLDLRSVDDYGTLKYNDKDLDFVAFMIEKYYDAEKVLLKVYANDEDYNASSNQIYASLLMYKLSRASHSSQNILKIKGLK